MKNLYAIFCLLSVLSTTAFAAKAKERNLTDLKDDEHVKISCMTVGSKNLVFEYGSSKLTLLNGEPIDNQPRSITPEGFSMIVRKNYFVVDIVNKSVTQKDNIGSSEDPVKLKCEFSAEKNRDNQWL